MNIAFAGLRHSHIFVLYAMAKENPLYRIVGAFEEDPESKAQAQAQGVACNYPTYDALLADPEVEVVALGGCYGDRGGMAIRALKALYESGALGEINNVYFGGQHPLQYGRRPMWYFEAGKHGGVINDIAIHGIDALAYALDLHTDKILAARTWNKFAAEQPGFKESGQLMLSAQNGAGIMADVSYAIPDGVEFALPYYWQFYIWGTKGVIRFSLNDEKAYYYLAGKAEPIELEEKEIEADYLTDFHRFVTGQGDTVLPMEDVFRATRATLTIQKAAN